MLITFTAIILAVIRQVMKIAVIITNRCETFMTRAVAGYMLPLLNPMMTTEEVKHAADNEYPEN